MTVDSKEEYSDFDMSMRGKTVGNDSLSLPEAFLNIKLREIPN